MGPPIGNIYSALGTRQAIETLGKHKKVIKLEASRPRGAL
jgi:hypothetical protein